MSWIVRVLLADSVGQVIARTTIDVPRTLGAFLGFLFWFPIPLERGFLFVPRGFLFP